MVCMLWDLEILGVEVGMYTEGVMLGRRIDMKHVKILGMIITHLLCTLALTTSMENIKNFSLKGQKFFTIFVDVVISNHDHQFLLLLVLRVPFKCDDTILDITDKTLLLHM